MTRQSPYIILADDDPDDQELLAESFLKQNPTAVIKFLMDGQEVLNYLFSCDPVDLPRLIILDYKMPIITGPEVLKAIEGDSRYKYIPRIVWSTSGNLEYRVQCLGHGANKYFVKPSDMRELDKIVTYVSQLYQSRL